MRSASGTSGEAPTSSIRMDATKARIATASRTWNTSSWDGWTKYAETKHHVIYCADDFSVGVRDRAGELPRHVASEGRLAEQAGRNVPGHADRCPGDPETAGADGGRHCEAGAAAARSVRRSDAVCLSRRAAG